MSEEYPKSKAELFSRIEQEWSGLMDVVAKLDEKKMTTPDAGGWSPKDNLAHIAEWMNILLGYHFDGRPSHEVLGVTADVTADWDFDVINKVLLERNQNRSIEDVLGELNSLHARVMDRLESMSFEDLLKPRRADDPQSSPLLPSVAGDTYEHFAEHREMIEKALKDGEHGS
jgi:hypothetical protein